MGSASQYWRGCNGCDIEILAALMPRFDLERFGVLLKATPRHADVMICTGAITRRTATGCVRVYEQVPEPKFVVAAALAPWRAASTAEHTIPWSVSISSLPVNAYVPGCPFRPNALIDAVVKLLNSVEMRYS